MGCDMYLREIRICYNFIFAENLINHFTRTEKKKKKRGKSKEKIEEEESAEEKDSGISEDESPVGTKEGVLSGGRKTVVQVMAERERTLKDMKIRMACLASELIEDPTKVILHFYGI